MNLFVAAAVVLTCLAVAAVVWPLLRQTDNAPAAPIAAFVLGLGMPAAVLLIYLSVSNHEWSSPIFAEGGGTARAAGNLAEMVANLETRLQTESQDVAGWLLLGRTYTELQRTSDARRAYARALALDPGTEAKLGVAEADIMLDRANLTGDAGRLIEAVLVIEPQNPKALFYGGMVAMARNDMDSFRTRWQLLLTMSPPEGIRAVIETQLAQVNGAPEPLPAEPAPITQGITVDISVAEGLAERIKPGAVLFLVARAPDRPGPPVAVIRRDASQLPATLNLSDRNSMMAGNLLSSLPRVELIARITNSGEPVAQPGDVFGEAEWTMNEDAGEGVSIVIDRVVD